MPQFRKKPVVINAFHYNADFHDLKNWLEERGTPWEEVIQDFKGELQIKSLEGLVDLPVGHYIIQGVKGEFYSCREDIFHATYEPA
ncbi:MAG: hypothetical protein V4543_00800 [Bacteroidota bacterium]